MTTRVLAVPHSHVVQQVHRVGLLNVAAARHELVALLRLAGGVCSLGGAGGGWSSAAAGEVVTIVNIRPGLLRGPS